MPKPRFEKKQLKGMLNSAKKLGFNNWKQVDEFKKADIDARLSIIPEPTKKGPAYEQRKRILRTEKALEQLLKKKPLLKQQYEYLYNKVYNEGLSIRAITAELGYKYPKAIAKQLDFFGIEALSRGEAIKSTQERLGLKPPTRKSGAKSKKKKASVPSLTDEEKAIMKARYMAAKKGKKGMAFIELEIKRLEEEIKIRKKKDEETRKKIEKLKK